MRSVSIAFVILILITGLAGMAQAQNNAPIEAPETYTIGLIGVSKEFPSRFQIEFSFSGEKQDGTPVMLRVESAVILQPDPEYFDAILKAEGNLDMMDLAGAERRQMNSHLAYLDGQIVTFVQFPDAESCGKQTTTGPVSILRLESQLLFPSEIFITGSIPPVPRIFPDVLSGDEIAAQYQLESFSSGAIEQGNITVQYLPESQRLVSLQFSGNGQFIINEEWVTGTLEYRYQLLPDRSEYNFGRPAACETPMVYGVELFEPSPTWITRELEGTYSTAQSFDTLIAFHDKTLSAADFKSLGEPFITDNRVSLSYMAPDGAWVRIDMTLSGNYGVDVEVRVMPEISVERSLRSQG